MQKYSKIHENIVMKKMLMLLALTSMTLTVAGQDIQAAEKHSVTTNSFWANWFVQGGVTWSAWYAEGETSLVAPFRKFPSGSQYAALGASLAFGKWFTPGIGLRTKVNAWQVGTEVDGIKPDKYWTANEQVMFNLSNMFLGYQERRLWNFIPYIGFGVVRNMSQNHYSSDLSFGLLNTLRLGKKWSAHIDLALMSAEGSGMSLKKRNNQFVMEVGLTYRLGKSGWKRTPDMDAINALTASELDALNAQLADAQAENDRLMEELNNQPKPTAAVAQVAPKVETKVVAPPVSIFFAIGKAAIATPRDQENVAALAKTACEHQLKVVITGYADSKTGTVEQNQRLSQKRADAVADQMVKLGVPREKIETKAAGGVETLGTSAHNRRVVVELK